MDKLIGAPFDEKLAAELLERDKDLFQKVLHPGDRVELVRRVTADDLEVMFKSFPRRRIVDKNGNDID